MKQKIILCILLDFMLSILTGCIRINHPDIVLKENGQPCISIPRSEDMLRTNRSINITSTDIYQTSTRSYLSEKYYPVFGLLHPNLTCFVLPKGNTPNEPVPELS
ncbi:hypothetical protein SASC598O11_003260 [Snodgrassella alvi SCGC AB-598-O11]|nr:hypothetical protein SASC598O11_003260 [Snodgrassella alvi SCGC AB-598-O11]